MGEGGIITCPCLRYMRLFAAVALAGARPLRAASPPAAITTAASVAITPCFYFVLCAWVLGGPGVLDFLEKSG